MSKALESLKPLFKEAREEGLWFWSRYQDLWFSPDELQHQNDKGSFRWGAVNWTLRDPNEKIAEYENMIDNLKESIIKFKNRIK